MRMSKSCWTAYTEAYLDTKTEEIAYVLGNLFKLSKNYIIIQLGELSEGYPPLT